MPGSNPFADLDMDEVRKLAEEMAGKPKEGWTHSTGKSPLKQQLQVMVRLLQGVRDEVAEDHKRQLKTLETLMRHKAASNPHHRIKK